MIKRGGGLEGLNSLKVLELNNNVMNRLDDIALMSREAPSLTSLDLRSNPICKVKTYKQIIFKHMGRLARHDGAKVTEKDRETSKAKESGIHINLIKRNGLGLSNGGSTGGDRPGMSDDENWMSKIEELDVSHQGIQYISSMEKLVNLRRAYFSDNEISMIEGLERNLRLEDLSLENNRVLNIDGIQGLLRLRKLELGHNRIIKIPPLEMFTRLTQLSLESNEISILKPLGDVPSLMELYIGNNEVENLNEINWLKR